MKHKVKYIAQTRYGDVYHLTREGYVVKYSGNGLDKMDAGIDEIKTWQITGVVEQIPFGWLGHIIPLSEACKIKTFRFKNKNPRYTMTDLDHGTPRTHGNIKWHGLISLREVE